MAVRPPRLVVRILLAALLVGAAACRRTPPLSRRIDVAMEKAAAFLRARQGPDGAIRSDTYAYFKDGYSLTPLALAALFAVGKDDQTVAQGREFLATMVGRDGNLRADASGPRYSLYSAALGVVVLNRSPAHRAPRDALVAYLKTQELPGGGWSYDEGGEPNLSATLYALGALTLAGGTVGEKTAAWVESCQNADGGFVFSPAIPDGNKAGPRDGGGFRSYGSMTADGYRALVRLGRKPTDPRVISAGAWLERHFDAERNPGDFVSTSELRRGSSYYYWTWTAAHALRAMGKPVLTTERGRVRWAGALAEALLAKQRPDGSWANSDTEMREDDPVVATSFALAALGICDMVLGKEYRSHAASPDEVGPGR